MRERGNMPRRNGNAGQPNREAQRTRRALRVQTNVAFRQTFPEPEYPVLNPGSDNLQVIDRQPTIKVGAA